MMQTSRAPPEERRNQKKAIVLPGINKLVRRQHQPAKKKQKNPEITLKRRPVFSLYS